MIYHFVKLPDIQFSLVHMERLVDSSDYIVWGVLGVFACSFLSHIATVKQD